MGGGGGVLLSFVFGGVEVVKVVFIKYSRSFVAIKSTKKIR